MCVQAICITTVTCDGVNGNGCPNAASRAYDLPQVAALRLAKKSGWCLDWDVLCPACVLDQAIPVKYGVGHNEYA